MRRSILIAILTLMPAVGHTQAPSADQITVSLSDPARPALLKVNLSNGSITIRTHSGPDLVIAGRGINNRPPVRADGLRQIIGGGGGLIIGETNNVVEVSSSGFSSPRNLDIQVPVKTNLNLKTVNGNMILVDGVEGEIEISNTNGQVRLVNVTGSVVAAAFNGALTAAMKALSANKPTSFTSMNSNVDVTLPADTKANVRIRTDNGAAYTDFEMQVSAQATSESTQDSNGVSRILAGKTVNGTINGGGTDLELRTLNGDIYLRRQK